MYQTRVTIHNTPIEIVSAYKYLGVYVDAALSWSAHIKYVCCKVQQRIYFLRRLRSFGANKRVVQKMLYNMEYVLGIAVSLFNSKLDW